MNPKQLRYLIASGKFKPKALAASTLIKMKPPKVPKAKIAKAPVAKAPKIPNPKPPRP